MLTVRSIWMPAKKTNQQHILTFYRGNEEFVSRLLDQIDLVERRQMPTVTPFLTSDLQDIVQSVAGKQVKLHMDGGYMDAESKRAVLAPLWWDQAMDTQIVLLKGCFQPKYHSINHRDVLGAIMHLGIERDVVGDFLVEDGTIYLFCSETIASYLIQNLTQIARAKIDFEVSQDRVSITKKVEWHTEIISSFRYDAVVAAITHLSRQKAQALIRIGHVKINQVTLEEIAGLCNNDCTVSIRGYGRFILHDTKRRTQKGNIVAEVGKYC